MARHCYTMANDTPVRMELSVHEMRNLCRILQREVAGKHEHRFMARDLHDALIDGLKRASESMRVEADYLKNHATDDMVDQLNAAIRRAEAAKTDA